MHPVELKKGIYSVGAVDWNIREFHGYSTLKGTTYNAYLVVDDKITLFDAVKKPFVNDLVCNISRIVDPRKIDYLVVNHVEMDHSGGVPEMIDLIQPEKVFCSSMGRKNLSDHFHREDWPFEVVETGKTISLGARTVQFVETRMLHWPDSMFSYLKEDRLLISSDAFGQHWATSQRFDDEVDMTELLAHAAKYYANILLPYSPLVQKLLASVQKMGLEIDMIAPDHGLIWRSHPGRILEAYDAWSRQKARNKAVVVYDTMWHATERMAEAIADGLAQEGIEVKLFEMKSSDRSEVMTEILDAKAVIVGSATLNNGILPTVADILCYMKGLRPTDKIGFAFGSYGWSGEAVKLITEALEEMKVKIVNGGIRVKFTPTHDDFRKCAELGKKVGQEIKAKP